jgi:hypothetical protein
MTLKRPMIEGGYLDESLAVAEELYMEAGLILGRLIHASKQDDPEAAPKLKGAIAEMSAGYKLAVQERNRVAEERRRQSGVVGDYAVDFDAARVEIGRRLACLRAAGDG